MEERADATPVYTMLYRPVSSCTLPRGVITEWVKLPKDADERMQRAFPGMERSEHLYGEFTTGRALSADEMESFQIKRVDPAFVRFTRIQELERRIETLVTERHAFASDPDEVTALSQMIDEAYVERDSLLAAAAA